MPHEIELKLELPANDLDRLAMLPWLNALTAGPGKRAELVSVYYDTESFQLREHGVSLRVRSDGNRYVQTIKAPGKTRRGPLARQEWEHEIGDAAPNLR
ncbi:MAG TPA: CYTH domain-containing protein, partial [Tepidisphaeraceae bacterium]|nr:CYTH domain-containing protein [Tepidisphaeraceae bacterium]